MQRDSAGVLPEPFRGATRQPAGTEPVRQQADVLGGQAAEGKPEPWSSAARSSPAGRRPSSSARVMITQRTRS